MSFDFRLPKITGTDSEKIEHLTRYIYRLTEQLNFSLNTIEGAVRETSGGSPAAAPSAAKSEEEKLEGAYASIKSMIIKSADVIESLTDKVSVSLGGAYLAKSEFGTYKETTNAAIKANSTGITQLYSYTSNLQSDYADYEVENKSYIKTGLLYYDGSQPVYGVGVGLLNATTDVNGRRTIDRQHLATTFTAGKISFWGNNTELAYITPGKICFPSGILEAYGAKITGDITATAGTIGGCKIENNKLVIDAAHITGTLEIGRLPNNIAKTSDIPTAVSALENDSGYQNESGVVSIVNGRITADYVQALGITVDAAKVTGKLTASQIDASDLKVSAANITGQLTIGKQLPSNIATKSDIPDVSAYQTASDVTTIIGNTVTTGYINALGISAASLNVPGKFYANTTEDSVRIGGWIAEQNCLRCVDNGVGTGFQIPSSGVYAIAVAYTDNNDWSTAPFRVTHGGKLYATDAYLSGEFSNVGTGYGIKIDGSMLSFYNGDNKIGHLQAGTNYIPWNNTSGKVNGIACSALFCADEGIRCGKSLQLSTGNGIYVDNKLALSLGQIRVQISLVRAVYLLIYCGLIVGISESKYSDIKDYSDIIYEG